MENIDLPVVEQKTTGPWALLTKVLTEPSAAFESLKAKPAAFQPYLILLLVAAVSGVLAYFKTIDLSMRQAAASGVSPEVLGTMKTVGMVLAPVGAAVTTLVVSLVSAAVLLFLGTLLDGRASFKQMFSMVGYASIPSGVIGGLVKTAMIATTPASAIQGVNTSAALLLPRSEFGTVLYQVLSLLDPFAIWTLVLTIIGYAVMAEFSNQKAAAVVIPLWLAANAIGLAIAARAMKSIPKA